MHEVIHFILRSYYFYFFKISLIEISRHLQQSRNSPHVWKFMMFFLAEVVGWGLPFFVIENYTRKIHFLLNLSANFIVFHLLLVNPVTISLFAYQIFSFWVVYRHSLIVEEELLEEERARRRRNVRAAREETIISHVGGNDGKKYLL